MNNKKLLTIAVPTFNRHKYLEICLDRIKDSFLRLDQKNQSLIEIIVSDNSINYLSKELIKLDKYKCLNIKYIKNHENIGSDQNLANCYSLSNAKYSMLIGDDDFVEKDFFEAVIPILLLNTYKVIFLKYYGYTFSYDEKSTKLKSKNIIFQNSVEALMHRNINIGFISGMIIKRDELTEVDINEGIGTNLVQVNACFKIMSLDNPKFIYISQNLIGAVRNNTGGYNPVHVFHTNYFLLLKKYNNLSLNNKQLKQLKNKILYTFYTRNFAQYIRNIKKGLDDKDLKILNQSYKDNYFYKIIISKLFRKDSVLNFFILTCIYIFANLYYYPSSILDFLKHFKYWSKKNT